MEKTLTYTNRDTIHYKYMYPPVVFRWYKWYTGYDGSWNRHSEVQRLAAMLFKSWRPFSFSVAVIRLRENSRKEDNSDVRRKSKMV
jgi:hypothetical protein